MIEMKAYIFALNGKPWNEECQVALEGFQKLGIECTLFSNTAELSTSNPENIVVGGMLIMNHVFTEMNIILPNFNYPDELCKYLGRKIWVTSLKELYNEKLPIFIKPNEEKAAKALLLSDYEQLDKYRHLEEDAEIICSDIIDIKSEWRCFIRYGRIIGIQHYNGDSEIEPDIRIIESAINDYSDMPRAFSLDFGITKDGNTVLIEMNDGVAIGCYGLDEVEYAKFLYSRWAEIVGVNDIFDKE